MTYFTKLNTNKIFLSITIFIAFVLGLTVWYYYDISVHRQFEENIYRKWFILIKNTSFLQPVWTASAGFSIASFMMCTLIYYYFKKTSIFFLFFLFNFQTAVAYLTALLPYYTSSSLALLLYFSIFPIYQTCSLLTSSKIYSAIHETLDNNTFNKFCWIGVIGLLFSFASYFVNSVFLKFLFSGVYFTAIIILLFVNYQQVITLIRQKIIGKDFLIPIIAFVILTLIGLFPLTDSNMSWVYQLKIIGNLCFPLAGVAFAASFSTNIMRNLDAKNLALIAVTQEKQAILEAQNETLAIQVAEQTAELKALNDTKDRLFSIIGHDLRSPLASLKGVLLLLNNQQLNREEFNELLQQLNQNVENAHSTLENLLQWSMSQMKEMKPTLKSFEVNDIIEQTVELFRDVAKQKQIDLQTNISEHLKVFADENHIRAVIRNLINNALKFTPTNGRVSISSKFKNNYVVLQITDTGVGITTDEMELIFTNPKLKQGTSGEKGTGLGLILCQDLIKQNSGEIFVRSEIPKGTTFEILIPQKAEY
jgi:signal transduction histidine kinase